MTKISRGYFRNIFGQGWYTKNTPLPPIPVAWLNMLNYGGKRIFSFRYTKIYPIRKIFNPKEKIYPPWPPRNDGSRVGAPSLNNTNLHICVIASSFSGHLTSLTKLTNGFILASKLLYKRSLLSNFKQHYYFTTILTSFDTLFPGPGHNCREKISMLNKPSVSFPMSSHQ